MVGVVGVVGVVEADRRQSSPDYLYSKRRGPCNLINTQSAPFGLEVKYESVRLAFDVVFQRLSHLNTSLGSVVPSLDVRKL